MWTGAIVLLLAMAFQQLASLQAYRSGAVPFAQYQHVLSSAPNLPSGSVRTAYAMLPSGLPAEAALLMPAAGFEPEDATTHSSASGQVQSVSTLAPDSDVASSMSGMTNVGPRPLPSAFPVPSHSGRPMPSGMHAGGNSMMMHGGQAMGGMMPMPIVMTPHGPMPFAMAAMAYGYYPLQSYVPHTMVYAPGPQPVSAWQGQAGGAQQEQAQDEQERAGEAGSWEHEEEEDMSDERSGGSRDATFSRSGKRTRPGFMSEGRDGCEGASDDTSVVLPTALAKELGRRSGRVPATEVYLQGKLLHSGAYSVGLYGVDSGQRQARMRVWMEAREKRVFHKKLKYERRHELANGRVRVKGRFVKDDGSGK